MTQICKYVFCLHTCKIHEHSVDIQGGVQNKAQKCFQYSNFHKLHSSVLTNNFMEKDSSHWNLKTIIKLKQERARMITDLSVNGRCAFAWNLVGSRCPFWSQTQNAANHRQRYFNFCLELQKCLQISLERRMLECISWCFSDHSDYRTSEAVSLDSEDPKNVSRR